MDCNLQQITLHFDISVHIHILSEQLAFVCVCSIQFHFIRSGRLSHLLDRFFFAELPLITSNQFSIHICVSHPNKSFRVDMLRKCARIAHLPQLQHTFEQSSRLVCVCVCSFLHLILSEVARSCHSRINDQAVHHSYQMHIAIILCRNLLAHIQHKLFCCNANLAWARACERILKSAFDMIAFKQNQNKTMLRRSKRKVKQQQQAPTRFSFAFHWH